MSPWSARLRLAVFATVMVLVMFAFVFPARAWLDQRREVQRVRRDVTDLEEQNRRLQREANRLETPAEIERLARERFNMVLPGEQAYSVVPAAPTAPVSPSTPSSTAASSTAVSPTTTTAAPSSP